MLVNDIIRTSLEFLGREDIAQAFSSGSYEENEEYTRIVNVLLHCFNAVEDELARGYFPLTIEENFTASANKIYFESFKKTPVKILSVTQSGKAVKYCLEPASVDIKSRLAATDSYTVRYEYCPDSKELGDSSDYSGYPVGERLIAYGIVSEYCLISGALEESQTWESKYRQEIERVRPYSKADGDIPARGWI